MTQCEKCLGFNGKHQCIVCSRPFDNAEDAALHGEKYAHWGGHYNPMRSRRRNASAPVRYRDNSIAGNACAVAVSADVQDDSDDGNVDEACEELSLEVIHGADQLQLVLYVPNHGETDGDDTSDEREDDPILLGAPMRDTTVRHTFASVQHRLGRSKLTSHVWEHFYPKDPSHHVGSHGAVACCLHCTFECSRPASAEWPTTPLARHLKSLHCVEKVDDTPRRRSSLEAFDFVAGSATKTTTRAAKVTVSQADEINDLIGRAFISAHVPTSLVDNRDFRRAINAILPGFATKEAGVHNASKLAHRTKLSGSVLDRQYLAVREAVTEILARIDSPWLMTDAWSDRQMRGFQVVNVVGVTDRWEYVAVTLGLWYFPRGDGHTAAHIADFIRTLVPTIDGSNSGGGIEPLLTRLAGVISDGERASLNCGAMLAREGARGARCSHCAAHKTQLVLKEFTRCDDDVLQQVGLCNKLAASTHQSQYAREAVGNIRTASKTRFNSYLYAVDDVLAKWGELQQFSASGNCNEAATDALKWIDITKLRAIQDVMEPLRTLTAFFSSELKVLAHEVTPKLIVVRHQLNQLMCNGSNMVRPMARSMLGVFDKHLGSVLNDEEFLAAAFLSRDYTAIVRSDEHNGALAAKRLAKMVYDDKFKGRYAATLQAVVAMEANVGHSSLTSHERAALSQLFAMADGELDVRTNPMLVSGERDEEFERIYSNELKIFLGINDAEARQLGFLGAWRSLNSKAPLLAAVAKRVGAKPGGQVKSERSLSQATSFLSVKRNRIHADRVHKYVFIYDNGPLCGFLLQHSHRRVRSCDEVQQRKRLAVHDREAGVRPEQPPLPPT